MAQTKLRKLKKRKIHTEKYTHPHTQPYAYPPHKIKSKLYHKHGIQTLKLSRKKTRQITRGLIISNPEFQTYLKVHKNGQHGGFFGLFDGIYHWNFMRKFNNYIGKFNASNKTMQSEISSFRADAKKYEDNANNKAKLITNFLQTTKKKVIYELLGQEEMANKDPTIITYNLKMIANKDKQLLAEIKTLNTKVKKSYPDFKNLETKFKQEATKFEKIVTDFGELSGEIFKIKELQKDYRDLKSRDKTKLTSVHKSELTNYEKYAVDFDKVSTDNDQFIEQNNKIIQEMNECLTKSDFFMKQFEELESKKSDKESSLTTWEGKLKDYYATLSDTIKIVKEIKDDVSKIKENVIRIRNILAPLFSHGQQQNIDIINNFLKNEISPMIDHLGLVKTQYLELKMEFFKETPAIRLQVDFNECHTLINGAEAKLDIYNKQLENVGELVGGAGAAAAAAGIPATAAARAAAPAPPAPPAPAPPAPPAPAPPAPAAPAPAPAAPAAATATPLRSKLEIERELIMLSDTYEKRKDKVETKTLSKDKSETLTKKLNTDIEAAAKLKIEIRILSNKKLTKQIDNLLKNFEELLIELGNKKSSESTNNILTTSTTYSTYTNPKLLTQLSANINKALNTLNSIAPTLEQTNIKHVLDTLATTLNKIGAEWIFCFDDEINKLTTLVNEFNKDNSVIIFARINALKILENIEHIDYFKSQAMNNSKFSLTELQFVEMLKSKCDQIKRQDWDKLAQDKKNTTLEDLIERWSRESYRNKTLGTAQGDRDRSASKQKPDPKRLEQIINSVDSEKYPAEKEEAHTHMVAMAAIINKLVAGADAPFSKLRKKLFESSKCLTELVFAEEPIQNVKVPADEQVFIKYSTIITPPQELKEVQKLASSVTIHEIIKNNYDLKKIYQADTTITQTDIEDIFQKLYMYPDDYINVNSKFYDKYKNFKDDDNYKRIMKYIRFGLPQSNSQNKHAICAVIESIQKLNGSINGDNYIIYSETKAQHKCGFKDKDKDKNKK